MIFTTNIHQGVVGFGGTDTPETGDTDQPEMRNTSDVTGNSDDVISAHEQETQVREIEDSRRKRMWRTPLKRIACNSTKIAHNDGNC